MGMNTKHAHKAMGVLRRLSTTWVQGQTTSVMPWQSW